MKDFMIGGLLAPFPNATSLAEGLATDALGINTDIALAVLQAGVGEAHPLGVAINRYFEPPKEGEDRGETEKIPQIIRRYHEDVDRALARLGWRFSTPIAARGRARVALADLATVGQQKHTYSMAGAEGGGSVMSGSAMVESVVKLPKRSADKIVQLASLAELREWAQKTTPGSYEGLPTFHSMNVPLVEKAGFEISRADGNRDILQIHGVDFFRVQPEVSAEAATSLMGEPFTSMHVVYVDMSKLTTPLILLYDEGTGIVLKRLPDGGEEVSCLDQNNFSPLLEIRLRESLSAMQDQAPWLRAEIRERLTAPPSEPLEPFIALGMLARLKSLIHKLLAGKAPLELFGERIWAQMNLKPYAAVLAQAAIAKVAPLRMRVSQATQRRGIDVNLADSDDSLDEDLQHIMMERDDLAGVELILRDLGFGEELSRQLRELDHAAEALIPRIRERSENLSTERLERAATASPESWWTQIYDEYDGEGGKAD